MNTQENLIATKEEATPALVPKLRFPEFRRAKVWHPYVLEELEDLGWVQLGRGDVISSQDIKAIPGDYPIYSSSVKNNGLMGTYGRFIFDEELISWSVDGGGDFFHRPRHKFSVTNVSGYMRLNTSHLNYRFLASHLQALHALLAFDYQFKAHPSVIRKLYRLAIPSLSEQQRIAECLSSVDDLIAAQARKLDALKSQKKGLMQQLFPREGETQPRLRFPEFQDAGEWSQEPLDHLVHFQDGFAFKSTDFVKAQEDATQVIRITDINNKNTNEDKVYIPTAFLEQNTLGKYRVDDGDLLLSLTGAAGFNFFFWNGGSAAINQRTAKVTAKRKSGHALLRLLEPLIHEKINERGEGQNNNLSKEFLITIIIRVPEPDEQHRIASCLSSHDALVTAEAQKLEALKTHKRGLMQQLFPSPEEVEA